MAFQVGVVIPLYNACAYLKQAVESVQAQPEVEEILIADDGSIDGSLALAQELARGDKRIKVLQHSDIANKGAGATRNLGINHCTLPFVAFLDADDYYLPGRFTTACALLEHNPTFEGVYEAVGTVLDDDATADRWRRYWSGGKISRVNKTVSPEHLFEALVAGGYGYFHLNGLTVRREVFAAAGLFNGSLRLHQDTEFCIRLAATARLQAGSREPVAVRRFHTYSRILAAREKPDKRNIDDMYQQLLGWGETHLDARRLTLVRRAAQLAELRHESDPMNGWQRTNYLGRVLGRDKSLIGYWPYWKLWVSPLLKFIKAGVKDS